MDLLNMTNKAQIHEFSKKVKRRKCLSFKPQFSNLVINWGGGSWQQNAKFQLNISKYSLLGHEKTHGHGV